MHFLENERAAHIIEKTMRELEDADTKYRNSEAE